MPTLSTAGMTSCLKPVRPKHFVSATGSHLLVPFQPLASLLEVHIRQVTCTARIPVETNQFQ